MKKLLWILLTAISFLIVKETSDFFKVNPAYYLTSITKMETLIYSSFVTENQSEFLTKVRKVSSKLNIDPNWLMGVMFIETAGTFSPAIQNNTTKATGLIQFMPSTASELGYSIDQLKQMTNVQQLDVVYAYLKRYRYKMRSFTDTYLAVFFPVAIGKDDDYVLQTSTLSAEKIASYNPLFDLDKNGQLTIGEIESALLANINPEYYAVLKKKVPSKSILT